LTRKGVTWDFKVTILDTLQNRWAKRESTLSFTRECNAPIKGQPKKEKGGIIIKKLDGREGEHMGGAGQGCPVNGLGIYPEDHSDGEEKWRQEATSTREKAVAGKEQKGKASTAGECVDGRQQQGGYGTHRMTQQILSRQEKTGESRRFIDTPGQEVM